MYIVTFAEVIKEERGDGDDEAVKGATPKSKPGVPPPRVKTIGHVPAPTRTAPRTRLCAEPH
eukprot:4164578-Amphidinium_carterae.1